jgi:Rrf2 family protein
MGWIASFTMFARNDGWFFMIPFPKKLFYAIEAVLYIAYNAGSEPLSSKEIAGKQGMPSRYLEQMMQKLVRAGILRGVRGPHGGYLLAREKRRITIADICAALAEDEDIAALTPLGSQIVVPVIRKFQAAQEIQLQETTLAELYDEASARNIRKSAQERNDFTI